MRGAKALVFRFARAITWAITRAVSEEPWSLRAVLFLAAVAHGTALNWGLPASDGWDVDGVAPRDILPGLALTYAPGKYFTYPPFHLGLIAALTLPVTVLAAIRAPTRSLDGIVREILAPPYMTAIAMTARVVTLLMSVGIVFVFAKIAEEVAPRREKRAAALGAALAVTSNASFAYYSHVTNLDVPYLFWGSLALYCMVRAITRRSRGAIVRCALFASFAITTKDQAYAMFALSIPCAIALWFACDRWARRNARGLFATLLVSGALAACIVLFVDGALTNWQGFRARLAFLNGSASQDFALYTKDAQGRLQIAIDLLHVVRRQYPYDMGPYALAPLGFWVLGAVGVFSLGRHRAARKVVASFLPLLVALSFTVTFNFAARRLEERFVLPQMLVLGLYAGLAVGWGWRWGVGWGWRWGWRAARLETRPTALRWLVGGVLTLPFLSPLWAVVRVNATMLGEPRYDAEAWLKEHAQPEDVVEVHGLNVYLARPTARATFVRVGPSPVETRNPMPGVHEVQARLSNIEARRPRFVVANECYVWRYVNIPDPALPREGPGAHGRVFPRTQARDASDEDATSFFRGLFAGTTRYRLAHLSTYESAALPRFEIHASLGCPVSIFEREPGFAQKSSGDYP